MDDPLITQLSLILAGTYFVGFFFYMRSVWHNVNVHTLDLFMGWIIGTIAIGFLGVGIIYFGLILGVISIPYFIFKAIRKATTKKKK